ncbi:MAG: sigma-70 factor domain-containing protein, partial [Patescibacteria group bacterium]
MPKKTTKRVKRAPIKRRPPVRRAKTLKADKRGKRAAVPVVPLDTVRELVRKGRQRGFLTETELLYAFPDLEAYIDQYEAALDEFEKHSIQIVENSDSILEPIKPAFLESSHSKKHLPLDERHFDLGDISNDSIQMYLREIGKVPLLTAGDEVSLAKRKEAGDV